MTRLLTLTNICWELCTVFSLIVQLWQIHNNDYNTKWLECELSFIAPVVTKAKCGNLDQNMLKICFI